MGPTETDKGEKMHKMAAKIAHWIMRLSLLCFIHSLLWVNFL